MSAKDAQTALAALGFSEIEALVYCFLLKESPATGYRISRGISKAAANTYAAIETLAQRGAVIIEEGEARNCSAVPPAELCNALEAAHGRHVADARKRLEAIRAAAPDEGVYKLETVEQAFAAARTLIDGARSHILMDAFPAPLLRLKGEIAAALKRGVVVAIESYAPLPKGLERAISSQSPFDPRSGDLWPGQQFNIVADAQQHLLALFDVQCGALLQGVRSNSHYLSCLQHSYMAASLYAQEAKRGAEADAKKLEQIAALALMRARPPGLAEFLHLYGSSR